MSERDVKVDAVKVDGELSYIVVSVDAGTFRYVSLLPDEAGQVIDRLNAILLEHELQAERRKRGEL